MKIEFTLQEIDQIALTIIKNVEHKIILFYGEMGVGKTTLIKAIAKQLGVTDLTSSPTFSIVNEYKTTDNILYHFDCYRLEHEEEAYDIGIEDYLYTNAWCFIEWPDKICNLLPEHTSKLTIRQEDTGLRTLKLEN